MSELWRATGPKEEELIITGASKSYAGALLGLLGSLNVNWPTHPRVVVYDLGLELDVVDRLRGCGYEVRAVDRFCPHWRKHFAWKIWCWNDAPAPRFLWLDAGLAVLRPLDEVFHSIRTLGYFVVPTYHSLTENASVDACIGCGVAPEFRQNRMTFAGGIIGFDQSHSLSGPLLRRRFKLATVEEYLRATEPLHRHDQAVVSLLLHRDFGDVICSDGMVYGGWTSPRQVHCQKIWCHRGAMRDLDHEYFARHLALAGPVRMPLEPVSRRGFRWASPRLCGPRALASGNYVGEVGFRTELVIVCCRAYGPRQS